MMVLEIGPKAWSMLGKCSATQLYPQPQVLLEDVFLNVLFFLILSRTIF
jgi:hypothetical protein